jgi:hypothetical protein
MEALRRDRAAAPTAAEDDPDEERAMDGPIVPCSGSTSAVLSKSSEAGSSRRNNSPGASANRSRTIAQPR